MRNQTDRQDSQDIADTSSVIGLPRHRPPKINQNTQSTQTGPQFDEQGTQVNIDEDTQYPWQPRIYPNIDEDIQPGYL